MWLLLMLWMLAISLKWPCLICHPPKRSAFLKYMHVLHSIISQKLFSIEKKANTYTHNFWPIQHELQYANQTESLNGINIDLIQFHRISKRFSFTFETTTNPICPNKLFFFFLVNIQPNWLLFSFISFPIFNFFISKDIRCVVCKSIHQINMQVRRKKRYEMWISCDLVHAFKTEIEING